MQTFDKLIVSRYFPFILTENMSEAPMKIELCALYKMLELDQNKTWIQSQDDLGLEKIF